MRWVFTAVDLILTYFKCYLHASKWFAPCCYHSNKISYFRNDWTIHTYKIMFAKKEKGRLVRHGPRKVDFLYPLPPHVHIDFVVPPPGCGRSVTDFWGWGAHRAQLHCPDDVSDGMCERGVSGGALNLNLQVTQTMVAMGIFPCKGKFPRHNRESSSVPHG
jgi:hypothetical protein